jgi:peptidoglycan/xylan/chitin deacetylase (PgdA/CDA1 family)
MRNAPGAGLTVALTFDDGPGPATPQVLDILRRERVRASFFLMGEQAQARPELVTRLDTAGHLVGIHGWSLTSAPVRRPWDGNTLDRQLSRAENVISPRMNETMDCWFRPPDRAMRGVQPTARQHGLTIALWTVDSGDWDAQLGRSTAPPSLVDAIVRRATAVGDQQHPVVKLHDGGGYRGATVAALPRIIAFYRSHGYRFVRMDGAG